jgi:hypothetical protein
MSDQLATEAAFYTTHNRRKHPYLLRESNLQFKKLRGLELLPRPHGHQDRLAGKYWNRTVKTKPQPVSLILL